MPGAFTVVLIIIMVIVGAIWAVIKMKEGGYSINWDFFNPR